VSPSRSVDRWSVRAVPVSRPISGSGALASCRTRPSAPSSSGGGCPAEDQHSSRREDDDVSPKLLLLAVALELEEPRVVIVRELLLRCASVL